MGAQAPSYEFYRDEYGGRMGEEQFQRALAPALAALRHVTGRREPPTEWVREWSLAWCALADARPACSVRTPVASETVGATSVRYAVPGSASQADYEAVLPWLSGTGLLYQGIGGGPHAL